MSVSKLSIKVWRCWLIFLEKSTDSRQPLYTAALARNKISVRKPKQLLAVIGAEWKRLSLTIFNVAPNENIATFGTGPFSQRAVNLLC